MATTLSQNLPRKNFTQFFLDIYLIYLQFYTDPDNENATNIPLA